MNTPEAHPVVPWLTPVRRAWLYRLVVTALPLLVLYGVAAEQEVAVWAGLAAAFLSTGTAALHTPTSDDVNIAHRLLPYDPEHTTDGGQAYLPMLLVFAIGFILGALCYANGIIVGT